MRAESWVPRGPKGEGGDSQGPLSPSDAGPLWAWLCLLSPLQLGKLDIPASLLSQPDDRREVVAQGRVLPPLGWSYLQRLAPRPQAQSSPGAVTADLVQLSIPLRPSGPQVVHPHGATGCVFPGLSS